MTGGRIKKTSQADEKGTRKAVAPIGKFSPRQSGGVSGSRGAGAAAPATGKTQLRDDAVKEADPSRDLQRAEARGAQQQRETEAVARIGKHGLDGMQQTPQNSMTAHRMSGPKGDGLARSERPGLSR